MSEDPMRDRLILPILIPVGALAFLLFLALVISQVLLNVPAEVAVAIAAMLAFNLLIAFSVIAARPNAGRALTMVMSGIVLVPLVLGGAAASGMVDFGDDHGEPGEELPRVTISANNLVFDTDTLEVPADTAFTLVFNNEEAQPHNVAILEEQGSATAFFRGSIITGPETIEEDVEPIPAGSYYFLCEVHPTMDGTVIAGDVEGDGNDDGDDNGAEAAEEEA